MLDRVVQPRAYGAALGALVLLPSTAPHWLAVVNTHWPEYRHVHRSRHRQYSDFVSGLRAMFMIYGLAWRMLGLTLIALCWHAGNLREQLALNQAERDHKGPYWRLLGGAGAPAPR